MKRVLIVAGTAALLATASAQEPRDLTSRVPKFTFPEDAAAQETALRDNPLMQRFRAGRRERQAERFRPAYHFYGPEGQLNDPNGLCFWQGRWHLFYQANPPDDHRWHWAHAVSDDLIHWRDLPYALYPNPEEQCYSGATLAEDGRVIAMYHGRELGNMCATSHDPLLLNWEKVTGTTVIPLNADGKRYHFLSHEALPYRIYDACIWKKGGSYYSLSGSVAYAGPQGKPMLAEFLFRSKDLAHWEFMHDFVRGNRFTPPGDDGACPYFWPIGARHILIFFSHTSSAQYLLGDYDQEHDYFSPTAHGRFCFGPVLPGAVQAPSAAPDGHGGVIAIFNMNPGRAEQRADGLMTLPRRLTLEGAEDLLQEPAGDVAALRGAHVQLGPMALAANREIVLPDVRGNALELQAEIDPRGAQSIELNVLRSANAEEVTRITFYKDREVTTRFMPPQKKLAVISLDNSRSSLLPDTQSRPPETASVYVAPDEPVKLRVFVDRSVVEVFVNGRQAVAVRVYPSRKDSVGVSLRAQGQEAELLSLEAWQMHSIFE